MNIAKIIRQLDAIHILMISIAVMSVVAFISERAKRALILNPYRVRRGEYHRLITSGWIHGDIMHLATNMFVLYLFADSVLERFGPLLFVVLFVTAVPVASLPTTIRYRDKPKYNSLGASGGVAAVMLSAILLEPTMTMRLLFFPFPMPAVVFGVLYIAYSMWHSRGSDDNINHDAHFSGAVYGVLVTAIWAPKQMVKTIHVLRDLLGDLIGV